MEAGPPQPLSLCLEDVLGVDGGHQIWEFLDGVSDHPRLFCTSRKLNRCKQIPQVAQLRYNEELKALNSLVIPEYVEITAVERSIIQKMAPYIQSGNYYLARRTQGSRGKTDEVYHSVKDALKAAVAFCLDLCDESGTFQEGWEGLDEGNMDLTNGDGVETYAKKGNYHEDPEVWWENFKCVNPLCRHKDNPEVVELIYRVDGEDHDQMYCGTCLDSNLYLQLRFAARHCLAYIARWEIRELRADNIDNSDDEDEDPDDEDVTDVEEPTANKLIQVNLWEWKSHESHASRSLWFVGTEAITLDKKLDGTTKQRSCKRQKLITDTA